MNDPFYGGTPRTLREAGLPPDLRTEAHGWLGHFLVGFIAGVIVTVTLVLYAFYGG